MRQIDFWHGSVVNDLAMICAETMRQGILAQSMFGVCASMICAKVCAFAMRLPQCFGYALDMRRAHVETPFEFWIRISPLRSLSPIRSLADCAREGYDDVALMVLCEIRYAPRVCAVYIYIYIWKKTLFILIYGCYAPEVCAVYIYIYTKK